MGNRYLPRRRAPSKPGHSRSRGTGPGEGEGGGMEVAFSDRRVGRREACSWQREQLCKDPGAPRSYGSQHRPVDDLAVLSRACLCTRRGVTPGVQRRHRWPGQGHCGQGAMPGSACVQAHGPRASAPPSSVRAPAQPGCASQGAVTCPLARGANVPPNGAIVPWRAEDGSFPLSPALPSPGVTRSQGTRGGGGGAQAGPLLPTPSPPASGTPKCRFPALNQVPPAAQSMGLAGVTGGPGRAERTAGEENRLAPLGGFCWMFLREDMPRARLKRRVEAQSV